MYTRIKTEQEIESMRKSGKILSQTLALLRKEVKPGIKTSKLNKLAEANISKLGGEPAFLNYGHPTPFPAVLCVSVNDEVVHGIPSDRKLEEGDLVSLDLGVAVNGLIADSAITVICGKPKSVDEALLVEETRKALNKGLRTIKNGVLVGDISSQIEKHLTAKKLGIVRALVGHGVGHEVHEDPNIPNFGKKNTGPKLVSGMTIAVEPMATLGNHGVYIAEDGWTVKTSDGSRAAHFEHTVLITDSGFEILTA